MTDLRVPLSRESVPYSLSLADRDDDGAGWRKSVIVRANVVGTDGLVREETHLAEFGQLKATRFAVLIRWSNAYLVRPGAAIPSESFRPWMRGMRKIPVPKPGASGKASVPRFMIMADRLNFIICPQHRLFEVRDAKRVSEFIHDSLTVHRVMKD
jgi:hypothetical protein